MKIFLSWSDPRSRAVAEALNDWLKRVIQAVKPFFSADIEKGSKWSNELDAALMGTSFGIICLTPDNLDNKWIHYEAGALSKTPDAMIWTFLLGVNQGNVPQPLGKFQHTVAEKKEDVFKLLKSINNRLADVGGEPLDIEVLSESFERYWPDLEGKLKAAESIGDSVEKPREDRDILLEILETVRDQQRITSGALRANVSEFPWSPAVGTVGALRISLLGLSISNELVSEIFVEINKKYPNISQTSDTMGNTTSFNLFSKDPITNPAVLDIWSTIEKMSGVSGIDAKIIRLTSRSPT
jgi:TIR domain